MNLSSRQFLHIIETLRSDPTRGGRATPRVGLRFRARMLPCVEAGPVSSYEVWVRDLSIAGIGFIHDEHLPIGSFVVIQLAPDNNDGGLSVLYKVMRSHQLGIHSVEIGAKIDHVLTDEELAAA